MKSLEIIRIIVCICSFVTLIFGQQPQRVSAVPGPTYDIIARITDVEMKETDFEIRGAPRKDFNFYHVKLEVIEMIIPGPEGMTKIDQNRIEDEGCIVHQHEFEENPFESNQIIDACLRFGGDEWFHGFFIDDIMIIDDASLMDFYLKKLQDWFRNQSEGGTKPNEIAIKTLDTPGWSVEIDVHHTNLEGKTLKIISEGVDEKYKPVSDNWIHCIVENNKFIGFCDPNQLGNVIRTFIKTVENGNF